MLFLSKSSYETNAFGRAVARFLKSGDVVLLAGEMGNGKSEIARGIAQALGVKGPVPSPSFTILNDYDYLSLPLHHFDFYRINDEDELYESGLDEIIASSGISLIEWFEKAEGVIPKERLILSISKLENDDREIRLVSDNFRAIDEAELLRAFEEEKSNANFSL